MQVVWTKQAQEDLQYWEKHHPKKHQRILQLVEAIQKKPFKGIGKPEPLRFQVAGYWSRRIDHEHRLVYKVHGKVLYIAQCRYHY